MDLKRSKRQFFFICCLYFFYYAAYTSYFSFLSIFLKGYGFTTSRVGLVFTCISLINLVSQPLLGYLGDNKVSIKRIVMVGMVITIPGAYLLGPTVGFFPLAIASILLIAFFDYSMIGLLDTWTNLSRVKNKTIKYSVARGMGSLSSAIAALIIGDALTTLGNQTIFTFHAVFMSVALVFVFLIDEISITNVSGEKKPSLPKSLAILWKNKKYRYYIISVFMVNVGWRAIITYLPIIILDFGGTSQHQGIASALMTIGIAPFMFIYPWLAKKTELNKMIQLGYVLTIVRILSITLVQNLQMMIWIQLFEAVSFGIFQPSMIEYISSITPTKNRAMAVSTAAAVQLALCGTVGNYFAGIYLEHFSFQSMFLVFGLVAIAGFGILRKSISSPADS